MFDLFTDPLLRGPFWGSLFLSIMLALVGAITFFAKKPLLGEVVAHCSYPGAILGLIVSIFFSRVENPLLILCIALAVSFAGTCLLRFLEKHHTSDSSMTLILSGFFGLGVFLSSLIQQSFPKFYRLAQGYLFGQVSTMTDLHIVVYGVMLLVVLSLIFWFSSYIKLQLFDPMQSVFIRGSKILLLIDALVALCLVLGIRGVGVVLVSSFFVAPALFSLRFCHTFSKAVIFSCGIAAGMNTLAFILPIKAPLGPVIVLLLSFVAFFSLRKKTHESLS